MWVEGPDAAVELLHYPEPREAVRLDPEDDRVRVNLANALQAGGRTADLSRHHAVLSPSSSLRCSL